MLSILLLGLAGAVLAAVVGTLWYSDKTPMGKLHMRSLGFDKLSEEEKKAKRQEGMKMMPKMYAAQLALSFLTAAGTAFIVKESLQNGLTFPMALGFVAFNWLCFMVPVVGTGALWSNFDRKLAWKKFLSDAGCNLVTVTAIAFMTSFFA